MSRIGKKLIIIPDKVKITKDKDRFQVSGPKGTLQRDINPLVDVNIEGQEIHVVPVENTKKAFAMQGLVRSLINNMVTGVSDGFTRKLEVNGVGYRVEVQKDKLTLQLGFSHPKLFELPEGISAEVDKQNTITLAGINNELLGQVAANIKKLRPVEPYKGKGIRYAGERVIRKVGKSGAK